MEVIEKRMEARSKVDKLSQRPDGKNESSIMSFKGPDEALNGALIGTEDEIHERLINLKENGVGYCLLYTSPSPRDRTRSRMPSSA